MSLPIVISQRAEQDLILQYQWYAEHAGVDVAERYLAAVDQALRLVAAQPSLGIRRRFEQKELLEIRSLPVSNAFAKHLIFYRAKEVLSLERVIHGARDLPRRLLEDPQT
jgi:toxin ParE1/3/4